MVFIRTGPNASPVTGFMHLYLVNHSTMHSHSNACEVSNPTGREMDAIWINDIGQTSSKSPVYTRQCESVSHLDMLFTYLGSGCMRRFDFFLYSVVETSITSPSAFCAYDDGSGVVWDVRAELAYGVVKSGSVYGVKSFAAGEQGPFFTWILTGMVLEESHLTHLAFP